MGRRHHSKGFKAFPWWVLCCNPWLLPWEIEASNRLSPLPAHFTQAHKQDGEAKNHAAFCPHADVQHLSTNIDTSSMTESGTRAVIKHLWNISSRLSEQVQD